MAALVTPGVPGAQSGSSSTHNSASGAAAPDKRPSFYTQLTRGVIRLEYEELTRTFLGKKQWVSRTAGTGFFVLTDRGVFLVTARHVVDAPYAVRARVPTLRRADGATEVVELRVPREAWVFHPQGRRELSAGKTVAAVDVAVAPVPLPAGHWVKTLGYCPEPCTGSIVDQFAARDPEPPKMVLVFGFPLDLGFELAEQRPMARSGIVSLVAGDYFLEREGAYVDPRAVLIDAPIYPGNSGSPVFSNPETSGRFELLGLITAANASFDYAVAAPRSRVAETLEAAFAVAPRARPSWHRLVASGDS